ncbi:MAG: peptide chain release factor 1 [Deltaproteobacteria bacterium]|nr:peptide chain release factor 1 [Deltaproteobacteria bacterium]
MFSQIQEIEKRYLDLAQQMADPAISADAKRYQEIAKEHSSLTPLIETFQEYKKVQNDLEGNRELLKDPDLGEIAKEEIPRLEEALVRLEQELKVLLLPKDPNDNKNIFLEIRAGAGGDEAGIFAGDLFRMYTRYAELKGWKVELMESHATGVGGFKEVIAQIRGDQVYSALKYEGGVHRVQRVPKTESSGRIHTSTVTVAVMPEAEDVDVKIEDKDLKIDVMRASGPGGQSVNTTDSAVRMTHLPSGIVVVCRDEKSQHKNKAKALKILKARLYEQELREQAEARSSERKSMVGMGDRSEKIRTYNFPQGRVTDHRIKLTLHQLDSVLEGHLDEMIEALRTADQTAALAGEG